MTGPLIDRDEVRKRITDAYYDARNAGRTMEDAADTAADVVLAYLRSVLTPEALWIEDTYDFDVDELHRRIFGEGG